MAMAIIIMPGTFPFCKTHGMASACAWRRDLSGRQARSKDLYCMSISIARSIDQLIDLSIKGLVAVFVLCSGQRWCYNGVVLAAAYSRVARCSPAQPRCMAYYYSTNPKLALTTYWPALTCISDTHVADQGTLCRRRCQGVGLRL